MGDDIFKDSFGTQPVTPDFGSLQTKGTPKLLVVIFVIDCSKTMIGDRIGAVNAALQELKYKLTEIKNDNNLELKIAIMSFTSNAKWELQLTPIEEVSLNTINTRPGLTEYGAAFHELNKVLRKDAYMQHAGKMAPPAIMFLTDGEPTDDYQADLDELLKNAWFANASRSAVLLGDAIDNVSARNAVRQFVNDENSDIVTAEDSTVIIQKIKIATMHTVAGDPIQDALSEMTSPKTSFRNDGPDVVSTIDGTRYDKDDPFGSFSDVACSDPFGGSKQMSGSFGGASGGVNDPFNGSATSDDDPFGAISDDDNPFGDSGDPFGSLS